MSGARWLWLGWVLALWIGASGYAHQVTPTQLVFREVGESLTVTVADCCTCQAQIELISNDTNVCVVEAPSSGSGISVSFTVTAVAPGTTTLTANWEGFGTDEQGFPCEDTASGSVEVVVLEPTTSSGNSNDSATVSDPVNSYAGEFFMEEPADFHLGGPIPLVFQRYYGSHIYREGFEDSGLGDGWLHTFDFKMLRNNDFSNTEQYVAVVTNRGRVLRFENTPDTGNVWTLQDNIDAAWQLVPSGSDFLLGDPHTRLIYRFNSNGRLSSVMDLNGNTVTLGYTSTSTPFGMRDRLTSVSDGLGRTLTLTYDGSGYLASVTDGTRTCLYSVSSGALTTFVNAASKTTSYSYDTSKPAYGALLTTKMLPRSNVPFTNVYDASGRVQSQTDPGNETWTFSYGAGSTTVTDPLANARVHSYDPDGQLLARTNDASRPIDYAYDGSGRANAVAGMGPEAADVGYAIDYHAPSGNVSTVTFPDGAQVNFTYVARSEQGVTFYLLSQVDNPDGSTDTFTYDTDGNMTSQTNRTGDVWTYSYDGQGNVLTATLPTSGVYTFTYNADGTLATMEDPASNVTSYDYDALLRVTTITNADASTIGFTYDPLDNVLTRTDENGITTEFTYNDNGNLSSVTDGRLNTTTYAYDDLDRVISITPPSGFPISQTFDALGYPASFTDSNGNATTLTHDPLNGQETSRTDAEGKTWTRGFDANGYVSSITDPAGNTTNYLTNLQGQVTRVTTPESAVWQLQHDTANNLSRVIDPLSRHVNFAYDAENALTGIDLMGGAVETDYVRGDLGRVENIVDSLTNTWQYGYDNSGRLSSKTDPLGNVTAFSYDNRSRIGGVTYPGGLGTQTITYAPTGEVTRRLYSDATDINYAYDDEGALLTSEHVTLTPNAQGEIVESNGLTIARDAAGRVESITYDVGKTVTYTYDGRDLPVTVTDWVGGVTTLGYTDLGHLATITRPNGITTTFTYNDDGILTSVTDHHSGDQIVSAIDLTVDARGRITSADRNVPLPVLPEDASAGFAYDAASQVSGYTYDAMGRLLDDGGRTYTWDLASRLTSYTGSGGTVSFTYDGLNMLHTRTEGGVTDEYVWNYGLTIPVVATVKRNSADFAYYVYTPYGHLLHRIRASNNSRNFYHFDEAGNTMYLTTGAKAVSDAYALSPYGRLLDSTGTTDQPFVYKGRAGTMREGNEGLQYVRARFYDANTARFLSRDPLNQSVSPLETNPYSYARANPLMFADPDGFNAKVIYDGGIHTDIAVDIWCGNQIIGTLKLGFFARNYNNLGVGESAQILTTGAPSLIKGSMAYGSSTGAPGVSSTTSLGAPDHITVSGTRQDDDRLARQLLEWLGAANMDGRNVCDIITEMFPLPKGKTTGVVQVNVNATDTYGSYRLVLFPRICNTFTMDALDVFYGSSSWRWQMGGHPPVTVAPLIMNHIWQWERQR